MNIDEIMIDRVGFTLLELLHEKGCLNERGEVYYRNKAEEHGGRKR